METLRFNYSPRTAFYFATFILIYEIGVYLANDMIMPGMLDVVRTFRANDNLISLSLTAFILGGGSLQLFLGPLSDRFGRYKVMIFGVVFFMLSNIAISLSTSMTAFTIARFFQGMGLCFISVIAYPSIHELFIELQAVRVISVMNNITITAPLFGPLIGVLIMTAFSWRMIFIVNALLAMIALIGLIWSMPETIGVAAKDGSLIKFTSLRFHVVKNNYLTLLRNKTVMSGSLALGLATVPIISWIGISPLILMKSAHLNLFEYGLWQVPIFGSAILGSICMRKQTYRNILPVLAMRGAWIIVVGLGLALILTLLFSQHYIAIVIGICIYSFGLSYLTGPLNRLILYSSTVPKGTVSALMSSVLMLITAMGNQVAGWVYRSLNNKYYALYCLACGLFFFLIFYVMKINYRAVDRLQS